MTQLKTQKMEMKITPNLPVGKTRITLDINDEATFNLLWNHFKSMGGNMYRAEVGYDKEFPYLLWENNEFQRSSSPCAAYSYNVSVNTVQEFLSYFTKLTSKTIPLTDRYEAVVHADKVVVGCQTITKEKVVEILGIMNELS